jgi:hypothetical protein
MTTSLSSLYSSGIQALMHKPMPTKIGQSIEELQQETRIAWWTIGGILTFAILYDLARNGVFQRRK